MSALVDHWEQVIKHRLVELVITKGFNDELTKKIAHQDIGILEDLLKYTRMEVWQDGHDTALMHGQSQNPYEGEPQ